MSPQLTLSQAADVLERHWALTGRLTELGSFEDQNFVVADDDGEARYVLKINGPERSVSLNLEHEILHGLARAGVIYDLPLPVPATSGAEIVEHGPDRVRLLRWVPGIPLADLGDQSPAAVLRAGRAGRSRGHRDGRRHPRGAARRLQMGPAAGRPDGGRCARRRPRSRRGPSGPPRGGACAAARPRRRRAAPPADPLRHHRRQHAGHRQGAHRPDRFRRRHRHVAGLRPGRRLPRRRRRPRRRRTAGDHRRRRRLPRRRPALRARGRRAVAADPRPGRGLCGAQHPPPPADPRQRLRARDLRRRLAGDHDAAGAPRRPAGRRDPDPLRAAGVAPQQPDRAAARRRPDARRCRPAPAADRPERRDRRAARRRLERPSPGGGRGRRRPGDDRALGRGATDGRGPAHRCPAGHPAPRRRRVRAGRDPRARAAGRDGGRGHVVGDIRLEARDALSAAGGDRADRRYGAP